MELKKYMENKKTIIILLLIILILVIIIIALLISNKNESKKIDGSSLSTNELINMFQSEGYDFNITDIDGTIHVNLENKIEGITIQRIYTKLIGVLMTFDDDSINDEMADLLEIGDNNTEEKKQQYKAYQSWMKKYNITKLQLSNMLDTYYEENKEKTEKINMDDFLNKYTME